jgi:hypothetical protein
MSPIVILCIVAFVFILGLFTGKATILWARNYARITGFTTDNGNGSPKFVEIKSTTYRLINPDDIVSEENVNKISQTIHKEFETLQTNVHDFIVLEKKNVNGGS